MRSLKNAVITGDESAVAAMRSLFGDARFSHDGPDGFHEDKGGPTIRFRVTHVLPNFYMHSDAKAERDPLYILVPDRAIDAVWPGKDFDQARYCTAQDKGGPLTAAIAVFFGTKGLYFCLTPAGEQITEIGALGI